MPAPSGRAMAAACTQTECLLILKWRGLVDRITKNCSRLTHTRTVARKVFQSRKAVCSGFRRVAHHRQRLPHNALPRTKATTQRCPTMAELFLTDQRMDQPTASHQACSETRWCILIQATCSHIMNKRQLIWCCQIPAVVSTTCASCFNRFVSFGRQASNATMSNVCCSAHKVFDLTHFQRHILGQNDRTLLSDKHIILQSDSNAS